MLELKNYLDQNPDVRNVYVKYGMTLAKAATVPLNHLLRHLIFVQGLNPDAQPGSKDFERFEISLREMFTAPHDQKSYDEDFNFTKAFNTFQQVNRKSDLSKKDFYELTDVRKLSDAPNLPVEANPVDDLRQALQNEDKSVEEERPTILEAQNLTYDMIARGLCVDELKDIENQIKEIMKFDRASFESMKRVVSQRPIVGFTAMSQKEKDSLKANIPVSDFKSAIKDLSVLGFSPLSPKDLEQLKKTLDKFTARKKDEKFVGVFKRTPRR